jgi:hypothetical protein
MCSLLVEDQNNGVLNTAACNDFQLGGPEPVNWAWVTKSGKSQAPANCLKVNSSLDCVKPGSQDPKPDADDVDCFPASLSSLVKIPGCSIFPDEDFDGQTYRPDWPGTFKNVALDQKLHPSSETFTSPLTSGKN